MLNLLVSYDPGSWKSSPYEFDKSRVAIEYTANEISERYKSFDEDALKELKSFPTLFVTENEATESRVGLITDIRVRTSAIVIDFEFDPALPPLPPGTIESLRVDLDLGRWELSRTHWAIKDEDLLDIVLKRELITEGQARQSIVFKHHFIGSSTKTESLLKEELDNTRVFVVHGHDEIAKLDVAKFIEGIGPKPVILHMQASRGMTIIEKIEEYSNVGFAVVLYTPCDVGSKNGKYSFHPRARQNVVFEHGYLIAKLGRGRVAALVKGNVEIPNDISGVIYIQLDEQGQWKEELKKEMKHAGYEIE